MNRWGSLVCFSCVGCATIGEGINKAAELASGITPEQVQSVVTTAAAAMPAPWNLVAIGVGGAITALWGAWYRRKLLATTPPTTPQV